MNRFRYLAKIISIFLCALLLLSACSNVQRNTSAYDSFTYDEVSFLFYNDYEGRTEVELYSPETFFVEDPTEIVVLYKDEPILTINDSDQYDIDGNTITIYLDEYIPRFDGICLKTKDNEKVYDIGLYIFEPISSHCTLSEANDMEIWLDDFVSSESGYKTVSTIVFNSDLSYDYKIINPVSDTNYITNNVEVTRTETLTSIRLESVLNHDLIHSNGIKYFTYESYILATNLENKDQKIVLKQYIPIQISDL